MQTRRLVTVGIELDHTIQRLFEEMSLDAGAEFVPEELVLELDYDAAMPLYIAWGDTDGTKPADITAANGIPLVAGQQRVFKAPDSYPKPDFRHLCFKAHADDDGKRLFVTYWQIVDARTPA